MKIREIIVKAPPRIIPRGADEYSMFYKGFGGLAGVPTTIRSNHMYMAY